MQKLSKPTNHHLPWVEKYRPTQLNQIVHHTDIIHLLRVFMKEKAMPHLFFYGPPGTGKTSTILSVANEIYGKYMSTMVLHLNASDERGIDVVRKQIIQFASTTSVFGNTTSLTKMVILDEADSMSRVAQIALRDVMMEQDTLFCFIGNYQYAFQTHLQSRVIKLLFTPIPKQDALALGFRVIEKEGYTCSTNVLNKVYASSAGDMRQFINLLQVIVMRGLMHTETNDEVFNEDSVDKILCQWNANKARVFIDNYLHTQSVRACYQYLHHTIVTTQQNTLLSWLHILFDMLLERTQHSLATNTEALTLVLKLCGDMATIESRLIGTLHPEIQLYAMVATLHSFCSAFASATRSLPHHADS